jgi:aspartate kinase
MPIVVQKFGGSSVADVARLRKVARKVADRRAAGDQVVVVVSAMGDTTDELLALAKGVHPDPPRRELDMLLTCGERISMALLSMALQQIDVPAISFTGSQSGIITTDAHSQARIVEVRPYRIQEALSTGKVVIVAGYQGVSLQREVTTLGRGGSDTTAVALAAALGADCEIYSDVDGIYSADPRVVVDAHKLEAVSYEEMQELACAGAKVLNAQAVEFARASEIAIHARTAHGEGTGTVIGPGQAGGATRIKGVTADAEVAILHARVTGPALDELLEFLDDRALNTRTLSFDGLDGRGGLYLALPLQDVHGLSAVRGELADRFGDKVHLEESLGTVTCVGVGVGTTLGPLREALAAAEGMQASVRAVHTSALQLSLVVSREHLQELTRRLHQKFLG